MPFRKSYFYILVLLPVFLGFTESYAQELLVLDTSEDESISLRPYAEMLILEGENPDSTSTLSEIEGLVFTPVTSFKENIGFSKADVWIRFAIENKTDHTLNYYLDTARPITDYASLFLTDGDESMTEQHSGDAIAFNEKTILHRKSVFKIRIASRQHVIAYLHLKSDGEVLMLPIDLIPEKQFLYQTYKEHLFYGFFYGVLLLACIIYLFFYSAMRNKSFLYYGKYVFFIALLQFSLDGFFHQYITPSGGWLSDRAVLASALISLFFFGKYGQSFLLLEENSPLLSKSIRVMSIIIIACVLALFSIPSLLPYCYPIANIIGLVVLLQMISAIVHLKVKRIYIDNYFIFGISFLVIGFVVFILNNLNITPNSFYTENGAKFGIGLEIIFLSLSMGNRIRLLRERNEKNQLLALQRAEDMNEIKSSFISNISHELRTPLNLIMGVTESLNEKSVDLELQQKCDLILSSSKSLMGHVEDILDFTVIEKGNQELNLTDFKLNTVLQKLIKETKLKTKAKNLDFIYDTGQQFPKLLTGDKVKLFQILNNLLDNAVKFTSNGYIGFHVEHQVKKKKVALKFSVTDSGIGISKEEQSTVFEAFTKNSFLDKREFYGMGLGLYIVKSYVDLYGGEINIKDNPSGGAIFEIEIELPYIEEACPVEIGTDKSTESNFESTRVLLVEDNKMNQKVIQLFAKKWGATSLEIADNGAEALKLLADKEYDVILMDLQMPVMDGFETTAVIRSGKLGKTVSEIPIIVVTADSTEETKKEVFRLGANDYITKPVKSMLLLEKIKRNLVTI